MKYLPNETVFHFNCPEVDCDGLLDLFRTPVPDHRPVEHFKEDGTIHGEDYNLFTHYSDNSLIDTLKQVTSRHVSDTMGRLHTPSRGWVVSINTGEQVRFHGHDRVYRDSPGQPYEPYPVGVFYTTGSSPIMFFPYHKDPITVPIEPGTFLLFRSDFHHFVPPIQGFRQSIAINFKGL